MFKQKELPFQSVLMHLSVVRAWLHFLSKPRGVSVSLGARLLADAGLVMLLVVQQAALLAFFLSAH